MSGLYSTLKLSCLIIVLYTCLLLGSCQENVEIYKGCGKTKVCFGISRDSKNCIGEESCEAAVAVQYNKEDNNFIFDLYGNNNRDAYIAVGLSYDSQMGDDNVVSCWSAESVTLHVSKNMGKESSNLYPTTGGISLVTGKVQENGLYCQFSRPAVTAFDGTYYDLNNDSYFLLLAVGPLMESNTQLNRHTIKGATDESLLLNDPRVSNLSSNSNTLVKVHGALMVIAWVGFAGVGVILARYFKKAWVGRQLFGKDMWFTYHRICMVITWGLTCIGFVVIFVEANGWTGQPGNPHAVLGVVTTALAFFQPIIATFFRPLPSSPRRPIFNWFHFIVGNGAHLLSIITLFFAVKMDRAELPNYTNWILTAFVVFYVLVHVVFQALTTKTNSMGVTDGQNAPLSGTRKIMLGVYTLIACGLTIALVVLVARG